MNNQRYVSIFIALLVSVVSIILATQFQHGLQIGMKLADSLPTTPSSNNSRSSLYDNWNETNTVFEMRFDPVAWKPPPNKGYIGAFLRNFGLAAADLIYLQSEAETTTGTTKPTIYAGPEALTPWPVLRSTPTDAPVTHAMLTGTDSGDILLIEVTENNNNENSKDVESDGNDNEAQSSAFTTKIRSLGNTQGRPLGLEAHVVETSIDNEESGTIPQSKVFVIIADAMRGLLRMDISVAGDSYHDVSFSEICTRVRNSNSTDIRFADDVTITRDGKTVYFTDASTRFSPRDVNVPWSNSTLDASRMELMEHRKTGRILKCALDTLPPTSDKKNYKKSKKGDQSIQDTDNESTDSSEVQNGDLEVLEAEAKTEAEAEVIFDNVSFANGITLSHDERSLLFVESGEYVVKRLWLEGSNKGTVETVIDNLPGFPDNISRGINGRYWVGIVSPRNNRLDRISRYPAAVSNFVRRTIMNLPSWMQPNAVYYDHVFAIDEAGSVLKSLQDPRGRIGLTVGALEVDDKKLYISSLKGNHVAVLDTSSIDSLS